ncbi:MAG: hypothetical protein ABFS17_13220 [Chloroflexota bacterium]
MKRMRLLITVGMVLLLTLACASIGTGDNNNANQDHAQNNTDQNDAEDNNSENDGSHDDEGKAGSLGETDFGRLLESGDLILDSINSNADEETNGRILTVQFTNPTNDEIIVSLPCGLIFVPTETEEQPMMMVQPLDLLLSPGESAPFTPYVVCADLFTPPPEINSGYTIGYLASDQLLAFAECICDIPLSDEEDSFDGVGVQFATWTIATNGDFTAGLDGEETAFGDEFEGLGADELIQSVTEMFSLYGSEWIDRCGIILEQPAE